MASFDVTSSNTVTKTRADKFIPEIWSDEIIAAYQKSLVMAPLVMKMNVKGKKGDTIHVPKPLRGSANVKAAATQVTIQSSVEEEVLVSIDQHYEYSRFIEDIVETQALGSLRQFYTADAGYALAKRIDTDLLALGKSLGDGDGTDFTHSRSFTFTSTGLTAFTGTNEAAFTDAGFRAAIQLLDDADVPMENRYFVIPPSLKNTLLGTDRYVSDSFVGEAGGGGIRNGRIGNIYGVEVYVSTNVPTAASGDKAAMLFHKDAFVLAEQMAVRSQVQYKQEFLSTLFTADTLYGVKTVRSDAGVVLAVPA
jgi:N4-gp56 family major capsid protein